MEEVFDFFKSLNFKSLQDFEFANLWDLTYLIELNPGSNYLYSDLVYFFILLAFIFSLLLIFLSPFALKGKNPVIRFVRRIGIMILVNTVLMFLYNLFRQEEVRILSMRLIGVVVGMGYVFILSYSLYYIVKVLPLRMERFREAKLRDKYKRRG